MHNIHNHIIVLIFKTHNMSISIIGRPAQLACASDIDWIPVLLLPNKTFNAFPDGTSEAANTSDRVISTDNKAENCDNTSDRHKSVKDSDQDDGVAQNFRDLDASCSSSECTLSCVGM